MKRKDRLKEGAEVVLKRNKRGIHKEGIDMDEIREGVIKKVGRKYFYVSEKERSREYKVEKDSFECLDEYTGSYNWRVYFSVEEIEEERLTAEMIDMAIEMLKKGEITLQKITEVFNILNK